MGSKVVVFGIASLAEVVHFYLTNDSEHEVVAFTVNQDYLDQTEFLGLPVVPFETLESVYPPDAYKMYVAVGYKGLNQVRASIYQQVKAKGYKCVSYISPQCTNWASSIGENCFIFEDNTLQPFVNVGNNVIMWSGNHIGHHSTIGSHCFITSHVVVSGHVNVGNYCFIGVNATLRDGIQIGTSCLIGAGALIMKGTQDKEVYITQRTKPDARSSDDINL